MKKEQFFLAFFVVCFFTNQAMFAQQQESYTFAAGSTYCYLFDTTATNTSSYYARWSTGQTAYVAHFMKDTIFQTSGSGMGGGSYGSVKKWACTSASAATLVWTYTVSSAHHDICPLPNGNVLMIIDETKTSSQISAAGGSYSGSISSPTIQEIHPTGSTTGVVVWQWKLWDHVCQSTNPSITSTYVSSISANPQLFNVNNNMSSDWFHMNGLDYNATLDQIVMSSHAQNEIYIIDHSTTTAQAASHSGGLAGHGGDFLYRWGRPQNYGCTSNGNGITLNTIHDARWVSVNNSLYPNYISMFHNNGGGTAKAVLFLPPHSGYNYTYTPGSVIPPTSCTQPTVPTITGVNDQGGVDVCDNGNILITKPGNTFYECNGSGTTFQTLSVGTVQSDRLKKCQVLGPFPSASTSTTAACVGVAFSLNSTASAPLQTSPSYTYSWSSSPSGFTSTLQNPSVTPTIAGNYTYIVTVSSGGCSNTASVNVTVDACTGIEVTTEDKIDVTIFPNPTTGMINFDYTHNNDSYEVSVYNTLGEILIEKANPALIDLSSFENGTYFVSLKSGISPVINKKVVLMKQ